MRYLMLAALVAMTFATATQAAMVNNAITEDTYYNGGGGANSNYSSGTQMQAGLTPRVGMFRVDMTGVTDAVTGVTLDFVASGGIVADSVIELFPVNQAWNLGTATYNTSDGTNAWLTPFAASGGYLTAGPYTATSFGSYTVPADLAIGDAVSFTLNAAGVAAAEGWRTGTKNGVLYTVTSGGSGNNALWVATSEHATLGHPNATITYVPEPATMSLLGLGGLALIRRRR